MDLDGADNPWADAPPSISTSREHLPPPPPAAFDHGAATAATAKLSLSAVTDDFGGSAFTEAFPTPSPTASAPNGSKSFSPPTSSEPTTSDPTSIPLPMSATSPNNPTPAQDGLPNAFASLTLGKENHADQAATADVSASAFDMSAPAGPVVAPVTASTTSASDPFGFGPLDAPASTAPAPAPAPATAQLNADALFGDFGAPMQAPPTSDFTFSNASNNDGGGAESDGFGDFADFATGDANAAQDNGDDDDDFGDFGDFETSTTATAGDLAPPPAAAPAPVVPAPPPATSTAAAPPLAPILQSLVTGASLPITGLFDLQSYLAASDPTTATAASPVPHLHIPLVHTAPDGTCYPRVSMNPVFATGPGSGYDDIQRLAEAPLFDEHISTRIRWRKCLVKKMYQAALEIPVDWDDKGEGKGKAKASAVAPATISTAGGSASTTAPAPAAAAAAAAAPSPPSHALSPITPLPDLATLTALAALTEDELRARTDDDLAHIQGVLASAVPGLHAQINYYLDAREQLALDAEMHNKMISVLVQQAQKSHGRFAKKGSPPKRK